MSETVKRLFLSEKMPVDQLERAVTKGWISREEADRLLSKDAPGGRGCMICSTK